MVKNEASHIETCLKDIHDLFDDIIILDTGSTDGTQEILNDKFNITPKSVQLTQKDCYSFARVRNIGIAQLKTPWVLSLDADEKISREGLIKLKSLPEQDNIDGYFCKWENHTSSQSSFEDYKCSLFRKSIQRQGYVHDNPQLTIRENNSNAIWSDAFVLHHYPNKTAFTSKQNFYHDSLKCALTKDPNYFRAHWFLGYSYFRQDHHEEAIKYLESISQSNTQKYVVECLNSKMVLAEIYSNLSQYKKCLAILLDAISYYENYSNDFEVRINFRLKNWLDTNLEYAQGEQYEKITVYPFAY